MANSTHNVDIESAIAKDSACPVDTGQFQFSNSVSDFEWFAAGTSDVQAAPHYFELQFADLARAWLYGFARVEQAVES